MVVIVDQEADFPELTPYCANVRLSATSTAPSRLLSECRRATQSPSALWSRRRLAAQRSQASWACRRCIRSEQFWYATPRNCPSVVPATTNSSKHSLLAPTLSSSSSYHLVTWRCPAALLMEEASDLRPIGHNRLRPANRRLQLHRSIARGCGLAWIWCHRRQALT